VPCSRCSRAPTHLQGTGPHHHERPGAAQHHAGAPGAGADAGAIPGEPGRRQAAVLLCCCIFCMSPYAVLLVWRATCVIHASCLLQLDNGPVTADMVMLQVLPLLRDGSKAWQPSDFLPESSDPDFLDKVRHSSSSSSSRCSICSSSRCSSTYMHDGYQCLCMHVWISSRCSACSWHFSCKLADAC
jgi:hypothetical protein